MSAALAASRKYALSNLPRHAQKCVLQDEACRLKRKKARFSRRVSEGAKLTNTFKTRSFIKAPEACKRRHHCCFSFDVFSELRLYIDAKTAFALGFDLRALSLSVRTLNAGSRARSLGARARMSRLGWSTTCVRIRS